MRRLLLTLALLINHGIMNNANAQEAPTSFTLTVTPAEIQIIGKGLGSQPYETVAPLMAKLQAQVVEQQKPKEPPKPEHPKPVEPKK